MTSLVTATSIKTISDRIKNGDLSPLNLVESCLERINKFNPSLDAFITILEERARQDAKIAEKQIKQGLYIGPLHGIPFSIKDVIYAEGVKCTAGSKIMSDYISKIDATSVEKMKKAGAILIGTNNTHEFACGITNVNPHYGSSKNPWNTSKLSGGSSGGSAVSVAAGMVPVSLATDTSGSIRVPSSLCGVVGLKPTYGRVSKYGIVDLAPSLDHVGCITRSAWDAAAVLQTIAGRDPLDLTTKNTKVADYVKIIEDDEAATTDKKISVGIPKEYFFDYLQPEVYRTFLDFIETIKSMDISVFDVHIGEADKIYESWRPLRLGESAEIHLKWLQTRSEDYGEDVRRMLMQGTEISAVDYIRAHKFRKELRNEFERLLKNFDVLVMPTTPLTAPRFEEQMADIGGKTLQIYQALSRHTIAFDSTGLPAISIPIGFSSKDNMPVGAQIIGPPFKEEKILSLAYAYEQINDSLMKFTPSL
jgi:aspartyl-tRNA(Asn)/glutamyl-tRNA(Gln) amidotransferase subunit A